MRTLRRHPRADSLTSSVQASKLCRARGGQSPPAVDPAGDGAHTAARSLLAREDSDCQKADATSGRSGTVHPPQLPVPQRRPSSCPTGAAVGTQVTTAPFKQSDGINLQGGETGGTSVELGRTSIEPPLAPSGLRLLETPPRIHRLPSPFVPRANTTIFQQIMLCVDCGGPWVGQPSSASHGSMYSGSTCVAPSPPRRAQQ